MLKAARLAAAAAVDRVFHGVALSRGESSRRRSTAESLGPRERMTTLAEVASFYAERADHIFPAPARASVAVVHEQPLRDGGRRIDLRWPSEHRSLHPEITPQLDHDARNAEARARLFVGPGTTARPAVLLFHGYLGGEPRVEEELLSARFLRSRGLDVALCVLPFHGARGKLGRPPFPSSDPRFSIEGFRQAIIDARSVIAHLRTVHGTPAIGAMGMSLGGYTSALLATVAPELSFVVPMIPLASIADFAANDGRYVGTATQQREQHEALERAFAAVSPLARAPLVPRAGRLVVAAEADRITPITHARKLADHFESELVTFPGGHLLQLGRRQAYARVMRMLEGLGLIPAAR
jgi:pimeloyl-ACP methyl ester carboxylesterase